MTPIVTKLIEIGRKFSNFEYEIEHARKYFDVLVLDLQSPKVGPFWTLWSPFLQAFHCILLFSWWIEFTDTGLISFWSFQIEKTIPTSIYPLGLATIIVTSNKVHWILIRVWFCPGNHGPWDSEIYISVLVRSDKRFQLYVVSGFLKFPQFWLSWS